MGVAAMNQKALLLKQDRVAQYQFMDTARQQDRKYHFYHSKSYIDDGHSDSDSDYGAESMLNYYQFYTAIGWEIQSKLHMLLSSHC